MLKKTKCLLQQHPGTSTDEQDHTPSATAWDTTLAIHQAIVTPYLMFKVEPFKHAIKVDPEYRDATWAKLEEALDQINNLNASGLSFEELYRSAYNMVINKFGEHLYTGLIRVMTRHLSKAADHIEVLQGEAFLKEMKARWDHHTRSMSMIRDILMYMDRIYVKNHNKTPVGQLGLDLWCQHVIRRPSIQSKLLSTLLGMIHMERVGEVASRGLVRETTQMLMHLGPRVYIDDFEIPFLRSSAQYFAALAGEWLSTMDCPGYLSQAESRFAEEVSHVAVFLDPSTEPKIIDVLEDELIEKQMDALVHMESSGLVVMLQNGKIDSLSSMYNLFKRVKGGHKLMRDTLIRHLKDIGKAMVLDPEKLKDPIEFMNSLLDLKLKYDSLIREAFQSDKTFQNALNSAFEHFLNLQPRAPEYMSLFLDDKLKRGAKGASEDELESVLDRSLLLFRYLSEKDVFEKYYKQHLSRRLLSGKGMSDDAERHVLVKLKNECGYQFTNKMESMFTDIRTSRDMMQRYKPYAAKDKEAPSDLDLSVQVLTTGSWPGEQVAQCILPPELNSACEQFREFYTSAYSGRRLIWQTNKGTADVKANFGGRRHEISMNTYQMCICLLFNDNDSLTFKEIEAATKIPEKDLKRNLQSLALVKGRSVLRKEPMSRDVEVTDVFHYNDQFQSKTVKLKIANISSAKDTEPAFAASRLKAEEDRKPLIESAIVRVMKSRKRLDHNSIVTEVTRQLSARFTVSPVSVKKHIEGLIQREFLERDPTDWKHYKYVA